jgi:hypothetical protein
VREGFSLEFESLPAQIRLGLLDLLREFLRGFRTVVEVERSMEDDEGRDELYWEKESTFDH